MTLPSKRTLVKLVRDCGLAAAAAVVIVLNQQFDSLGISPAVAPFVAVVWGFAYRWARQQIGKEPAV